MEIDYSDFDKSVSPREYLQGVTRTKLSVRGLVTFVVSMVLAGYFVLQRPEYDGVEVNLGSILRIAGFLMLMTVLTYMLTYWVMAKSAKLEKFIVTNGFRSIRGSAIEHYKSRFMNLQQGSKITEGFAGERGGYAFEVGSVAYGEGRASDQSVFGRVKLPHNHPYMVFKSKRGMSLEMTRLPDAAWSSITAELPVIEDQKGYRIHSLSSEREAVNEFFDERLVSELQASNYKLDVEVIGDEAYVYPYGAYQVNREVIVAILKVIETISKRYSD